MSAFSRRGLATLLAWAFALTLSGCGRPGPEDMAPDIGVEEFITGVRQGRSLAARIPPSMRGWDNDAVIDALAEIIAKGRGRPTYAAAAALAHRNGLQTSQGVQDSRALDFMLPARIAPILLTALDSERVLARVGYHENLLLALGSIDAPTPAVVAAVRQALKHDDPRVVASATKAAGMLGVHAAEMAGHLEALLHPDDPGRWDDVGGRRVWIEDRAEIAGALARVSDRPHAKALQALVRSARGGVIRSTRGGERRPAPRAVGHLRALGPRAEPAIDDLLAILHEKDVERPTVATAIAAISRERLRSVVYLLADLCAGPDRSAAFFADRELLALSREWGDSAEMRGVAPALIAALNARPAADGLQLSKAIRRIDTRGSRKAYDAYLRRERHERGARDSEWTP